MKSRADIDPQLHILRSLTRALTGPARSQVESARFNLYAAFEERDKDKALSWSLAMRAALKTLGPDDLAAGGAEVVAMAIAALGQIDDAIG